MSQATWCRLCLNICDAYKHIYDENGHYNAELYEVTVKYFDPMFLTVVAENQLAVMCLECWHKISEFHNFYNVILLAQEQLRKLDKLNSEEFFEGSSADHNNRIEVPNDAKEFIAIPKEEVLDDGSGDRTTSSYVDISNGIGVTGGPNEAEFIALPKSEAMEDDQSYVANLKTEITCGAGDESEADNDMNKGGAGPIEVKPSDDCSQDGASSVSSYDDSEEYEEPIGVFTGGEFNKTQKSSTTDAAAAEDGSDDDNAVSERAASIRQEAIAVVKLKRRTTKEIDAIVAQWKPSLQCLICQKAHSSLSAMMSHYGLEHPLAKFHITCCKRNIIQPSRIADHALVHTDPNSFKCLLCLTRFPSNNGLYRHLHAVHSLTDFDKKTLFQKLYLKCNVCEKTFPRRIDLVEHMGSHTGVSLYQCQLCRESFLNRYASYRHFRKNHPQEWANRKSVPTARYITTNPSASFKKKFE